MSSSDLQLGREEHKAHEAIRKCRSCGASIVWVRTRDSKLMPVDEPTIEAGETVYIHGRHRSHYATCPQGPAWRKPPKPLSESVSDLADRVGKLAGDLFDLTARVHDVERHLELTDHECPFEPSDDR